VVPQVGRAAKRNRSAAGFKLTHYRRVGKQVTRLGAQGFLAVGQPEYDTCVEDNWCHGRRSIGQSSAETGAVGSS